MWEYSKSELSGLFIIRAGGVLVAQTGSEATARRIVDACNQADRQEKLIRARLQEQADLDAQQ